MTRDKPPRRSLTARTWDVHAEARIARFIRRYLRDHPAPRGAELPGELEIWAGLMEADARIRLAAIRRDRGT